MTTTLPYLDAAFRIGAQLAREAVWHEGRCNWYAPFFESVTGAREEAICTLGPNLYDGTAGVALFLAELYRLTGDPVIGATARGGIEHALLRLCDVPEPMRQGFHTGAVGIGHAAVRVGRCLGEDRFVEAGMRTILDAVDEGRIATGMLDVVSGAAGTIPAILNLHRATGDARLLEAAWMAGAMILARAHESERGLSWDTMGEMARALAAAGLGGHLRATPDHPDLTGLSHGAGGIGLALLELAAATDDAGFHRAARSAFDYEDGWFDSDNDVWPDLRRTDQPPASAPSAWCHGAAGIGLVRLRAFQITGEARFREDALTGLRIAGRSIRQRLADGQANYSLCHGVAGDAELFLLAAQMLDRAEALEVVRTVADHGLKTFAETGAPWPSGAPGRAETPGLMLGLAGTGYFYLRMADPMETPSVLLLLPERQADQALPRTASAASAAVTPVS